MATSEVTHVWLGKVGYGSDGATLVRLLETCGDVIDFHWWSPHSAHCAYKSRAMAEAAVDQLNGYALDGKYMIVKIEDK